LVFNPAGVGHVQYVPYFSTQSGNVTAINIVNTDTVNGKVLKIRFRGASNSDDLYDFQVFMSPGDVWTAGVTQGANGLSQLTTTDKSCTLPANINGSFITGRISPDGGNNETREGYIEILTMADIVDKTGNKAALYKATKHVKGSAPCSASVLTALTRENSSSYMEAPTTGLMANWTIINVQAGNYYAYSASAAAIEARTTTGVPATGNLVYWDQRSKPLTATEILGPDPIGNFTAAYPRGNTADPLIRDGSIVGARYDLPDMSTPYLPAPASVTFGCPSCQAVALSRSIAVSQLAGEFYSESTLGAQTDWVISFPTRRYAVAVDYADDNALVFESNVGNVWFNPNSVVSGGASNGGKDWQACVLFGTSALAFYTREEEKSIVDDIVISPGTPTSLSICGEVSVLGINAGATTATFGSVARANVSNGFKEGWGSLTAPGFYGMPMLARQFTRVSNTQTNVFYGLTYPAREVSYGAPLPAN